MGGPVERDSLSLFSYELPISELKCSLDSNIVPLGKIQTGIFYHRALLFKVSVTALLRLVGRYVRVSMLSEDGWKVVRVKLLVPVAAVSNY